MFGEITNETRASWAAEAIGLHAFACKSDEDAQTNAKDLVTNVFHFLRLDVGLSADEARAVMEAAIDMAEIEMNEDEDADSDEDGE